MNISFRLLHAMLLLLLSVCFSGCNKNSGAEQTEIVNRLEETLSGNVPEPVVAQEAPSQPLEPELHPYSIEELRNYKSPAGTITIENEFALYEDVNAYRVSYPGDAGVQYAALITPKGNPPEKGWPVIVLAHGYVPPENWKLEKNYVWWSAYYARAGFAVLKPDYRGHDKSAGSDPNRSLYRTIEYSLDVLSLIEKIESLAMVDSNRIFFYGHSMGGEVGLRVLTLTDKIKAATLWAPVSVAFPENTMYFLNKKRPNDAAAYKAAIIEAELTEDDFKAISPIYYLNYIRTPFIIQHGTEDESVPYSWSIDLEKLLQEQDVPGQLITWKGADHNFLDESLALIKKDVDFFLKEK